LAYFCVFCIFGVFFSSCIFVNKKICRNISLKFQILYLVLHQGGARAAHGHGAVTQRCAPVSIVCSRQHRMHVGAPAAAWLHDINALYAVCWRRCGASRRAAPVGIERRNRVCIALGCTLPVLMRRVEQEFAGVEALDLK
jgi:hypothetical protein